MKIYLIIILTFFSKHGNGENLKLLILHNNDMHSRFEETSRTSGTCKDKTNCYGGFARVLHVVREARKAAADGTGPPVLYLNAGDTYTGTSWFSVHKWKIAADFLNLLHPDVASLGNHEFDNDVSGLVPFLHAVKFPVVAANVDFSREPDLMSTNVTNSYVLQRLGHRIGIIGYLLPETVELASTGNVIFTDEVEALRKESERLVADGVKIIIALGHSGFLKDKIIAKEVPLVDIVIGGHSNTLLWNGPKPDLEEVEGPYPVVITQDSGKKVLVVQAYAHTKYLGHLNVEFDEHGDVIAFDGQPLLLNASFRQSQDALNLLEIYRESVESVTKEWLGVSKVFLDGSEESCRHKECNLGNLVTDAFVAYRSYMYKGSYWTDTPIALYNGGAIRNNIESPNGNITFQDVITAFPYTDSVCILSLSGSDLLKTLEVGVRSNGETSFGEFLQVSGITYRFDLTKPPGSRIVEANVRCGACSVPHFETIKPLETYKIITRQFLCSGGDGFEILKNAPHKVISPITETEIITWYIKKMGDIYVGNDGRITNIGFSSANIPSFQLFLLFGLTVSVIYIF